MQHQGLYPGAGHPQRVSDQVAQGACQYGGWVGVGANVRVRGRVAVRARARASVGREIVMDRVEVLYINGITLILTLTLTPTLTLTQP